MSRKPPPQPQKRKTPQRPKPKLKAGKARRKAKPNPPDLWHEMNAGHPSILIAGIDEVGRGCLAGPVVAAAVVLPSIIDYEACPWLHDVADSKLVDAEDRERLDPLIREWAPAFAIGAATVEEIDRINIFHASHLAMVRALEGLSIRPAHVLVDGKFLPKGFKDFSTAIIKGDLKCLSIACASLIAKVFRDRLMVEHDTRYPGYGFASNKGYGTPVHHAGLEKLGVTEIHRRSFEPVALTIRRRTALV